MFGWFHGQPREATSIGRESRAADEIGARDEHLLVIAAEGDRDDRVHRLAIAAVVLAHADEAPARGIELEVRVAQRARPGVRGDRLGRARGGVSQPVQPAVAEVRVDDQVAGDEIGAAAVLVDARADVDPGRAEVCGRSVGVAPDEDLDAALGRPPLEPVDPVAVESRLAQAHDAGREQRDRQR